MSLEEAHHHRRPWIRALRKKEESVGLSLVELEIRRGCKKNFEEMSYIKSLFSNKSQDSSDIEKDIAIQSSFTL